jgi:hypothetical protein
MILISHRGNLTGPNKKQENSIDSIKRAIDNSFDVEIDVWFDNGFWLGHDNPQTKVNANFLQNPKLWCHAKNIEALYELSQINTRYFWHQNDDFALTSDNFIWTLPNKNLTTRSICLLFSKSDIDANIDKLYQCYGICSDNIEYLKEKINYE